MHGRARDRPQALPAAVDPRPDLRREEPVDRRRHLHPVRPREHLRGNGRRRLRALRETDAGRQRDGLRRSAGANRQRPRAVRGGARPLARRLPPRPRRRVPGHQPGPVPAAAAAHRRARQPDGRRRRGPVGLRLPARRHPQHPRLRARLPRGRGRQARAELPLDADDPLRRQRCRRPQPRAPTKRLWTELKGGEPVQLVGALRRARGGALGRRRDRAARRGAGGQARGRRGLLPDQRDEPGARGHAGPLRAALPGDRRDEVLRAGRDQGRGRLPEPAHQPLRPGLVRAGRELAAARDRENQPGPAGVARQHDRAADLGGRRRGRGGPGMGAAAIKAIARFHETMEDLRRRADSRRGRRAARGDACARAATSMPSPPSGRSRPRGGRRTSRSWSASPPSSTPTASSRGRGSSRRWRSSSSRSPSTPSRTASATSR